MEEFKIFVTFHGAINESCYSELSPEEFSHFVFVAVNEKRPKTYPQDPKYKIIKEWELPIYDTELQRKGYNENSVIYHVYINKLYGDSTRVGFCQYDMHFQRGSIDYVKRTMTPTSIHPMVMCGWNVCEGTFSKNNEIDNFYELVSSMNEFFPNAKFSKEGGFPLANAFILPVNVLNTIMPWIIKITPKVYADCQRCEPADWRRPGVYLEHAMGIVLSSLYNEFRPWPGVTHPITHGTMHEIHDKSSYIQVI